MSAADRLLDWRGHAWIALALRLYLAAVFIIYSMVYSRLKGGYQHLEKASWRVRMKSLSLALPTVSLAMMIIGSIYTGIATPSESAGLGFIIALIMTFAVTFLVLGYLGTTGNIDLPPGLDILTDPIVMSAAGVMYVIEFFAAVIIVANA